MCDQTGKSGLVMDGLDILHPELLNKDVFVDTIFFNICTGTWLIANEIAVAIAAWCKVPSAKIKKNSVSAMEKVAPPI